MRAKIMIGILLGVFITAIRFEATEVYRVDQILARHIKAAGGDAFISGLESIQYTAQVKAGGLTGTSITWVLPPYRIRYELHLGVINEVSCYNGRDQWVVDANGVLTIGDEMAQKEMASEALLGGLHYMFPDSTLKVRYLERVGELDRSFLVLEVQSSRALPLKLWIDEQTWLLAKAEIAPEGLTVVYEYDDYRSVDGLMLPFSVRKSIPQLQEEREFTVLEAKINQPVDERQFILQEPTSQEYVFANSKNASMPFELDMGRVYFTAQIAGQGPFDFIFDTQAEFSAIDSRVATRLGLAEVSTARETTLEGYEELPLVRLDSLSMPGLGLYGQVIASLDHDRLSKRYPGRTPAVVLGYDILSSFVPELRFSDNTLIFNEQKGYAASTGYSFIECYYMDRFPVINGFIEDMPARLVVSTSSPSSVDLSEYFVKRHNLMKSRMTFESELHPFATNARMYMARTKLLSIGPFEFENAVIAFAQGATSGILASNRYDGIAGTEILRRFDLAFDYQGARIAMRANDAYKDDFTTAKSGLELEYHDDGRIIVARAIPGSPAESAQIEPGSELLEIGGKDTRSLGVEGIRKIITGADGTELELKTLKGGQTRTSKLILKTYY